MGACTYALSNAAADTPLERLAWLECQRYFVERTNGSTELAEVQDAKSEAGWVASAAWARSPISS